MGKYHTSVWNHPIHGDPTPDEMEEYRQHCRDTSWQCPTCGRVHPEHHKTCWHCKPTGYLKPNAEAEGSRNERP
jgi:hypothetical protein